MNAPSSEPSSALDEATKRSLKLKTQTIRQLSRLQYCSAAGVGIFLGAHLAAPLVSLIAPPGNASELATKTMILSRTFVYQNTFSEPILVWGSLLIHVLAGLSKRFVQNFWTISSLSEPTAKQSATKRIPSSISIHSLTGYLLIPSLTIHAFLNRIIPSKSISPCNNLSPSELDYSYVSYGFRSFPITSTLVYVGLIVPTIYHVVVGSQKLLNIKKGKGKGSTRSEKQDLPSPIQDSTTKENKDRSFWVVGTLQLALFVGLNRIGRETEPIPTFVAKRFRACYELVWPFSLLSS